MEKVQENVISYYKAFYFGKTCAETCNFSLPKKLGEQTFPRSAQ
jgi:hypothetical protein